jgi:hypothetical protein
MAVPGELHELVERFERDLFGEAQTADWEKIRGAISTLSKDPLPHGVRTLKGKRGSHLPLRVGDYGVINRVQEMSRRSWWFG